MICLLLTNIRAHFKPPYPWCWPPGPLAVPPQSVRRKVLSRICIAEPLIPFKSQVSSPPSRDPPWLHPPFTAFLLLFLLQSTYGWLIHLWLCLPPNTATDWASRSHGHFKEHGRSVMSICSMVSEWNNKWTNTEIVSRITQSLWEITHGNYPQKLKIESPYALFIPLLDLYSKQMKLCACTPVFIRDICTVIFFVAKLTIAKI